MPTIATLGRMTLSIARKKSDDEIMKLMSVFKKALPTFVDIESKGLENVPKTGPAILVGDHPNIMDGVVLSVVCDRPVRMLVAAELCSSPWVSRIIDNLGWLPVERHESGKNSGSMKACLEALERGEVVAIFPEGKTNYGKELLPFKSGAALLAHKSGAPVIPFSVKGTEKLYPDGSKTLHSGKVAIQFGEEQHFQKEVGRLQSTLLQSTLSSMREAVLDLQDALSSAEVGGVRNYSPKGLLGAGLVKAISLSLLTVKWNR